MYKSLIAAAAMLVASTPALAGTVSGEVRFADTRGGGRADSTEYTLEYKDVAGPVAYGAELSTKQDPRGITSKGVVKAGPRISPIGVYTPAAYVELGRSFNRGNNYNFWGVGTSLSRPVYGPVSVSVGFRHREGFTLANMVENRFNAGVSVKVVEGWSTGAQYYRTRGTTANSDAVGITVAHSF